VLCVLMWVVCCVCVRCVHTYVVCAYVYRVCTVSSCVCAFACVCARTLLVAQLFPNMLCTPGLSWEGPHFGRSWDLPCPLLPSAHALCSSTAARGLVRLGALLQHPDPSSLLHFAACVFWVGFRGCTVHMHLGHTCTQELTQRHILTCM